MVDGFAQVPQLEVLIKRVFVQPAMVRVVRHGFVDRSAREFVAVAHVAWSGAGASWIQRCLVVRFVARPVAILRVVLAPEVFYPWAAFGVEEDLVGKGQSAIDQAQYLSVQAIGCVDGMCAGRAGVVDRLRVVAHRQAEFQALDQAAQLRIGAQPLKKLGLHVRRAKAQRRQIEVHARYLQPLRAGGSHQRRNIGRCSELDDDGQPLRRLAFGLDAVAGELVGFGPGQVGVLPVNRARRTPVDAGEFACGQGRPACAAH
ncbi:hypothetical protein FQZ97_796740 [compost metagenome]